MATYTYDPTKIMSGNKDAMRFQLGDTQVSGESSTAFLADEEISAVLEAYGDNWNMAKYKLIEGVCQRLSFEVDFRDDGTSFSLNQRAQRWFDMLEKAKNELPCVPKCAAVETSLKRKDGGHYFYAGMLDNPYVEGEGR